MRLGEANRPYRGGCKAFDRFKVGGGLAGGQAAGGSVGPEDAVPAAFEAVGGEGEGCGEIPGVAVEGGIAAVGGGAGDGKLGADEKAIGFWAGGAD